MSLWRSLLVLFALLAVPAFANDGIRFQAIPVILESDQPVAAWQFELTESDGRMQVVGVENGDSDAFPDAPYFDRDAIQLGTADRIIVADFSLAETADLPLGDFRLATIHVRLRGDEPGRFELRLVKAVDADGNEVDAEIRMDLSYGS